MIYFIQGELTKLVKIGRCSGDVLIRLRNLQIGSAEKLFLIGTLEESRFSEKEIHASFAELWTHGEWFRPDDKLLSFIKYNANNTSVCVVKPINKIKLAQDRRLERASRLEERVVKQKAKLILAEEKALEKYKIRLIRQGESKTAYDKAIKEISSVKIGKTSFRPVSNVKVGNRIRVNEIYKTAQKLINTYLGKDLTVWQVRDLINKAQESETIQ